MHTAKVKFPFRLIELASEVQTSTHPSKIEKTAPHTKRFYKPETPKITVRKNRVNTLFCTDISQNDYYSCRYMANKKGNGAYQSIPF
jgi:hypothetical protein